MKYDNFGYKYLCVGDFMEYLTMKEASQKWGVSSRMVTYYCANGKIEGAIKKGDIWLVPSIAEKPIDGRTVAGKKLKFLK